MSKRNQTINRIYQLAKPLQLNAVRSRFVRRLIEQAYDAGRRQGHTDVREILEDVHTPQYRDLPYNRLAAIEALVKEQQ